MVAAATAELRFPAVALRCAEDFHAFCAERRDLLDERYRREQELGTRDPDFAMPGTCGFCVRTARFYSRVDARSEQTADGRKLPSWRDQQVCNCLHAMCARDRALAHLAALLDATAAWCRVAALGHAERLAHTFAAIGNRARPWARPSIAAGPTTFILGGEAQGLHMLLWVDQLHCVRPLSAALQESARLLAPGGVMLFTVPFHVDAEATQSLQGMHPAGQARPIGTEPVHRLGWDLLGRVRHAGFEDCIAWLYWSEELGYLGTYNIIFQAVR